MEEDRGITVARTDCGFVDGYKLPSKRTYAPMLVYERLALRVGTVDTGR